MAVFALQIMLLIPLIYMVFVGYVYTHNIIGTKRLVIYFSVILVLFLAGVASVFLKQVRIKG